jgi:tetratricopeptide (TPR) repeat protein
MKKAFFLFLLLATYVCTFAQSSLYEDSLQKELSHARNIPDRLLWLNKLAVYYIGINNKASDDYAMQMMNLADSSRNREWMVKAWLYNADRYYDFSHSKENVSKGIESSQKALEIAKNNNLNEWTTWAYIYMARGAVKNRELDKALNYSNLALSMASGINKDSLQVYVFNALGDTYLEKNEKLLAFRNYLQALDRAEQKEKYELLQVCYFRMQKFYSSLEDYEKAKDFEFKKEALQLQYHRPYDLMNTYNEIGLLYQLSTQYDQALQYYEKSAGLANSLRFKIGTINSYEKILNLYLGSGQYQKGLEYFKTHKEFTDFLSNAGLGYVIDQAYGIMYLVMNRLDSAGYYLKKAEPYFLEKANKSNLFDLFTQMGLYYRKTNDYDKAIAYYLKASDLGEQTTDLNMLEVAADSLDVLYKLKGDYKNAYKYNSLSYQYKDSLRTLAKEKDMQLLEIDNENRQKEREAKLHEEEVRRSHNIQYMGITVAIACIFILLVGLGVFKVSKSTIEALGFFAFIFLFEFIILIADNTIHELTHGEPWKVLAIKIGLIAILLPLHHKLEERVIHYLTTQELLHLKGKRILGKWRKKKDADLPMGNL